MRVKIGLSILDNGPSGKTLGQASKFALNSSMAIQSCEKPIINIPSGKTYLNTLMTFGDPGLVLPNTTPSTTGAKYKFEAGIVTVEGPSKWEWEHHVVANNMPGNTEIGTRTGELCYLPCASGVCSFLSWNGEKGYDTAVPLFTVTLKTSKQVDYISFLDGTDVDENGAEIGYELNTKKNVPLDRWVDPDGTHMTTFVLHMLEFDDCHGKIIIF